MQLLDGRPVFAATDLVAFLACDHLVGLELAALAGLVDRPVRADPEIDLIATRGIEHERRYLAELETNGLAVTRIEQDESEPDRARRLRDAAAATETALRRGDPAVYQGVFFDGTWLGFADFLLRVDRPSDLGAWSYEVVDTKLARHVKGSALLQICSYVEHLTRIQGVLPELMHVALGGSAREVVHERVADYMAYFRTVKRSFEAAVAGARAAGSVAYPPVGTYPEPVEHCDVCRWAVECRARRRRDDDLSLVAGAPGRARKLLKATGIETRRGLGTMPDPPRVEGVGADAMARLHAQAQIQVRGEDAGRPLYELLPPNRLADGGLEPDRGLLSLPVPRPGDLFFDIEGDPYALDDGVDYLFGILEPGTTGEDGQPLFHAFWAIDENGQVTRAAEKRAFEQAIDLMTDRIARDPEIHVFHYAPYEPTAAGRLMGRHATREEAVDRLLRGGAFVDLYRTVRQGMRASVESYSIKKLEPLYGLRREVDLRDAGSSMVEFEAWLAATEAAVDEPGVDGDMPRPKLPEALRRIEGYNRDDCVSNWRLRDWLEERRIELADDLGEELPRPQRQAPEPPPQLSERLARVVDLEARLLAGLPEEREQRDDEQQARWLLAQLLSWHRREEKSFWWRYYYLLDLTDEERIDEREPIAGLVFDRVVDRGPRSTVYRYRYPEQEHEIDVDSAVCDPVTRRSPGSVVAVDDVARTIDLRRGPKSDGPHPTSLVPCDYVDTSSLADALFRAGEWVAEHGMDGEGEFAAGRALLLRRPPAGSDDGTSVRRGAESALDAGRRVALALRGQVLAVQGPPGSGKTYLGASLICDHVAAGLRVGVTANSHKVIGHLLEEAAERSAGVGVPVRIGQKADRDAACTVESAQRFDDYPKLRAAIEAGELDLVGGTAWLWSRPEFAGAVDVLIVDEASQLSLANAVAVSGAAAGLILLGDPQQLEQPLQGTHPPGAEASALGHVLAGEPVIPPDRGLFLERTRRMHPDVCRFTSEAFYEGRLSSLEGLDRQCVEGSPELSGAGLRFVAVRHQGNTTSSPEEAEAIARLVAALHDAGATWTRADGSRRPLDDSEIVIVAPYNAQVAELAETLRHARVGTVDKFQGQQAAIAIYSMATSTPADAPRGMEFLYSLNRLNVATSRARCLAVVVASPSLLRVNARTPRQMRLANALCRFLELADPVPLPADLRPATATH